jgi:hypothetical protein
MSRSFRDLYIFLISEVKNQISKEELKIHGSKTPKIEEMTPFEILNTKLLLMLEYLDWEDEKKKEMEEKAKVVDYTKLYFSFINKVAFV